MEILFEQDNEEKSVASLILDALVKVEKSYSFYMSWHMRGQDVVLMSNHLLDAVEKVEDLKRV